MSCNFLCYFQTLLREEKHPSPPLGCVGGMEEALFQSAAFLRSCSSHLCQAGGSVTLSFYSCDKISRNSLQGFYKWLCSVGCARNEADA